MIPGVSFNGKHCYTDMGMVMSKKVIGMPEPQTSYVQVPGMDGMIDLTTALTGDVKYNSRTLELTFQTCDNISKSNWASFLSAVALAIHGKEVQIIFDEDQNFYYIGRCAINSFETDQAKQTIVIDCTCDPYKYDIESPGSPWLWDPFSFVDGIIYNTQITVEGTATADYINRSKRVTPTFICSAAMTVTYQGMTYSLKAGTNVIYEITFDPDSTTTLLFTGNGTVNVTYEVGVL